jgi:hypothetical protein
MRRRTFLQTLAAAPLAGAAPLRVVDSRTGKPLPARILMRAGEGGDAERDYVPPGAVETTIWRDRWFVAEGPIELPPGDGYTFRVEHGTEYRPVKTSATSIALERWIDMRRLGYASGDNHLHVPAGPLVRMMDAEGLDFGASLEWWNGPKLEIPADADTSRVSVHDAEVENAWGSVLLNGLRETLTIPWDARRSNLAFVREARRQGALICYQGGWSREVLLDALLGAVDVVNVCNNNFHRYRFQPRAQDSNPLGVEGLPVYPNTAEGMMLLNMESYYRLLNCGLRLAAGAESATGAKHTPAGYNRAYVRVGRKHTIGDFREAWRRGRNFVTNGPMIFLTVDGTREPGDSIALPAHGGEIAIRATAVCDQPLQSLEVLVNGEVVAAGVSGIETRLPVRQGCWIAARATAEDRFLSDGELARYHTETGRGGEKPTRLRFGHTSPVYVTCAGFGARVEQSVREARRMLDGFERFAHAAATENWRAEILEALATARAKLG